jgi:diguanylate cyclase (GGDEF)-like protein
MQNKTDIEYSLIMFDIDHFKNINDSYGHEMGDKILQSLAKKVKSHLRRSDHIARWGGEEFVIICPNTDLNIAFFVANLIRESIANTRLAEQLFITCSFGIAQFRHEAKDGIKSMFEAADSAMYLAKKTGRNKVEIEKTENEK